MNGDALADDDRDTMSSPEDEEARARLRERLGAGARYDSPAAPMQDLTWARRGTAYFARKLNELGDGELDAPSLVAGWTRRHVVAHVGYHARAMARLASAARNGLAEEILTEPENQNEDVEFGATLPAHALRYLFDHSAVHLNVEWRDLTEAGWNASVRSLSGSVVKVCDTPRLRAQEVWLRAVDLDNKGSFLDFPPAVLDRLTDDILSGWAARGVPVHGMVLHATDRATHRTVGNGGPLISGRNADIVRWLSGRGAAGLTCRAGEQRLPSLPPVPFA